MSHLTIEYICCIWNKLLEVLYTSLSLETYDSGLRTSEIKTLLSYVIRTILLHQSLILPQNTKLYIVHFSLFCMGLLPLFATTCPH